MICPIEIIDFTSALVGADWYEEQGKQEESEQIRELSRPPFEMWIGSFIRSSQYNRSNKTSWSSCQTRRSNISKNDSKTYQEETRSRSYCNSRKKSGNWSGSNSKRTASRNISSNLKKPPSK